MQARKTSILLVVLHIPPRLRTRPPQVLNLRGRLHGLYTNLHNDALIQKMALIHHFKKVN